MKHALLLVCLLYIPLSYAIESIPVDTEQYLYGLGVDVSHNKAQKLALANITQKLSTRVQSTVIVKTSKKNNKASSSASQQTSATSQAIELPNVTVIKNTQKEGQWWVLVRVERKHVQASLKKQIIDLNDEISFLLEDYNNAPGPACWFALVANKEKSQQLSALIPTYIGTGVEDSKVDRYQNQVEQYQRLLKRCAHRNKYVVTFPDNATNVFKSTLTDTLKAQGYKITKATKGTGNISVNFTQKYTLYENQHLVILNGNIIIIDEVGDIQKQEKFKSKGVSFGSQKNASERALTSLSNKLAKLNFKK